MTGDLRFMPRAKRALEHAGRDALTLRDRSVEHILLGLLDPKGNMAVERSPHLGAESEAVRVHMLADLGKVA